MSSGPENRFIKSVNSKLPKEIHSEKMHNPYRGGTADVWYSAKYDMWIEYKWIKSVPKKGMLIPDLSPLQKIWCTDRWNEGRSVFVVVGCPEGAIIFSNPAEWNEGSRNLIVLTKPAYISWLVENITGEVDENNKDATKRRIKHKQPV